MTQVAFLWLLGGVTALFGVATVWMLVDRSRLGKALLTRPRALPPVGSTRANDAEPYDDGAATDDLSDPLMASEAAVICPTCGARYGRGRRRCSRDASPLAALH